MGFVFSSCTWLAGWLTLGILVLSLSAGLYLACDLAEEYASVCKRYLHKGIYTVSILYILFAIDGLPWSKAAIGILSHLSLLPLLKTYPIVEVFSITTIWSVIVTIGNHLSWFYYFLDAVGTREHDLSGLRIIGFFFLFVWTVPLGFFISLTSADECLPMMTATSSQQDLYAQTGGMGSGNKKPKGIFKSFIDSILNKKDEMYPGIQKRSY